VKSSEITPILEFFEKRNWKPFTFQKQVWKSVLGGDSGLLYVPTGSGKTYAATMGIFASFLSKPRPGLKALYITPLRALARDIEINLRAPIEEMKWPIRIEARTGDTSYSIKRRQLTKPSDLLLTTPESLALMISQPDAEKLLSKVEFVILDEWHELMSSKRGSLLELSLSYLRTLNPDLQTWAMSASIGNIEQAAAAAVGRSQKPVIVTSGDERALDVECLLPDKLDRFPWAGHLGLALKEKLLEALDPEVSTLIFTNTRMQTEKWFQTLQELKPEMQDLIAIHHSSLSREEREAVEEGVKNGSIKWVVCTSSLDLGVDFQPVEQVVQIGSPKMVARMLQRAGRSSHRPGGKSRLLFLPTNAWEILELEALKKALSQKHIEARPPLYKPVDVLIQHMSTLGCGPGLKIEELWPALKNTYSFSDIAREELNWCLKFLTSGGEGLKSYPEYHKLVYEPTTGKYWMANSQMIRFHRMSIGTIVKRETVAIAYMNRSRIGTVDESFVAKLKRGDIFQFAGRTLQFIRLHDMTVYVKKVSGRTNVIPSWGGNRFPISETLSAAFREVLTEPQPTLHGLLRPLLGTQEAMSVLPDTRTLLLETFSSREGEHLFVYPFEGKLVHEGLAQLWALRFAEREAASFSFSVNDYGFEILAHKGYPFEALFDDDFFSHDQLQSEISRSLHISEMTRRQFREIAQIAGLIFSGYPGSPKTGRQKQVSSSLLFEVFQKYDTANLLLQQSRDEVLLGSLEVQRLRSTLDRMATLKQYWQILNSPSPLAFPILIERIASRLSNESLESKVARLKETWEKRA
jgi:ATP-dependent Lhr-like helicase